MTTFKLGLYLFDVDIDATRAAYEESDPSFVDPTCCAHCRNYLANADPFPAEMRDLLESMGIVLSHPYYMYLVGAERDDLYMYNGVYHVVGWNLPGPERGEEFEWAYWRPMPGYEGEPPTWDERRPGWGIWVASSIAYPDPAFRDKGIFQLEVETWLPWVTKERPFD